MKWFKHVVGSLKDPIIHAIIDQHGGDGYLAFFGILDLMADDFDIHNPAKNTFTLQYISDNLQLSRRKTVKILKTFNDIASMFPHKNGSIVSTVENGCVFLRCDKLKELCDEFTQKQLAKLSSKSGLNRERIGIKSGANREQEEELEEDKEKTYSVSPKESAPNNKLLQSLLKEYHGFDLMPRWERTKNIHNLTNRESHIRSYLKKDKVKPIEHSPDPEPSTPEYDKEAYMGDLRKKNVKMCKWFETVLAQIKDEVSDPSWIWFNDLTPISKKGDTIKMYSPVKGASLWIHDHYAGYLTDALKANHETDKYPTKFEITGKVPEKYLKKEE